MRESKKFAIVRNQLNAYWCSILLDTLDDALQDAPIAVGYPTPRELSAILKQHCCLDAMERELIVYYGDNRHHTLHGKLCQWAIENYGNGFCYPAYYLSRYLVDHSEAYRSIEEVFRCCEASNFFADAYINSGNHAAIGEKLHWECREVIRHQWTYTDPPWFRTSGWNRPTIKGHYAHISTTDPTKIAYTPNTQYGERNRKIVIRPGRYLKQFYPDLSDEMIARFVGDMGRDYSEYDLKFAVTPDEIEQAYRKGPSSCMSKSPHNYMSSEHPVRVYGNSDLQLAYLELKKEKRITSRCLVWPEKKKIGRVYGDVLRIMKMLSDLGYTQDSDDGSDLVGARFRRIQDGEYDCLIMPYIDGTQSYRIVDSDWCKIASDGNDACFTHGLDTEEPDGGSSCTCERCGGRAHEDDMREVQTSRRHHETWCDSCRDDHGGWCDYTEGYVGEITEVIVEARHTESGYTHVMWARWIADDNAYWCDSFSCYVSDTVPSYEMDNGEMWSEFAFKANGVEIDGKFYNKEDFIDEPSLADTESAMWNTPHGNAMSRKSWMDGISDIYRPYSFAGVWDHGNVRELRRKQELAAALAA